MIIQLPLSSLFAGIGFITLAFSLIKIWHWIRIYARRSGLSRYAHSSLSGEEPWALVTGASDGVGKAFAKELAANGFNVVLHGRNPEKLKRVASELRTTFARRSFRTLVADAGDVGCAVHPSTFPSDPASEPAALDFAAIAAELHDLHLTVLINNAGGARFIPDYAPVLATPESVITEIVSLNALFPLHLMRALLPKLAQHQPSLVLNVSSMADQGLPLNACYSGSKALLMSLTRALRLEMAMEKGLADVELLGVRFGRVTGAAGFTDAPSLFVPSTEIMARAALARAGHDNGVVVGYWGHALIEASTLLFAIMPQWLQDKIIIDTMRASKETWGRE
ncbi:hypothetical protein LQW54_002005 [Pestalotiopsis sp. IQ-011]